MKLFSLFPMVLNTIRKYWHDFKICDGCFLQILVDIYSRIQLGIFSITASYLVKSSSLLSISWECCECSDWVKDGRGMRGLWSPPGWGRSSERGEGLEMGIVMEEVDFGTLELDCVLG